MENLSPELSGPDPTVDVLKGDLSLTRNKPGESRHLFEVVTETLNYFIIVCNLDDRVF